MKNPNKKVPVGHGPAKIFAIPALVFAISFAGLVMALLLQGWPDAPAALAAGLGVFVALFYLKRGIR